MEEPKTLSYDWQYGREELFLRVDSYMSDDNLYIGLYHMEDGYPESFADLTVNLPFAPLGRCGGMGGQSLLRFRLGLRDHVPASA